MLEKMKDCFLKFKGGQEQIFQHKRDSSNESVRSTISISSTRFVKLKKMNVVPTEEVKMLREKLEQKEKRIQELE